MYITKVKIENFKCYKGMFELNLKEGLNIIVGDNEAGKSTILEAINLALTGMINGRGIWNEVSQYLFNKEVVDEYIDAINSGTPKDLPHILIEVYFGGNEVPTMNGNYNTDKSNESEGFRFEIAFNDKYADEYSELIKLKNIKSIPIEYYDVTWTTFARESITTRSIPFKSSLIDSSQYRYQGGTDIYLSKIIKENLEPEDVIAIAQAHRKMRDSFMGEKSIENINAKINKNTSLTDKKVELSVELVTKNAWENSLVTQMDSIPFNYVGKGEQCIVKTELALAKKTSQNAGVLLFEEPENHLSHTRLNQLIKCISEKYTDKQLLISTHNSFVANKLGLDNIMLLNDGIITRFCDISKETNNFFKKIAGYDTLRLILCKRAILCEGDSDELVIQKAYMQSHNGKLPIEDGIEVISVGTSFLRFLEVAERIQKKVAIVTDNDGDIEAIDRKYKDYIGENAQEYIKICVDRTVDDGDLKIGSKDYNYNTLEPKLLKENGLSELNKIFGTSYKDEDSLRKYMKQNKTECSLKIFETDEEVKFPEYIMEAINE
ncbi:MAG: AAA family ATPase [Lachnospiraceae bacterium]|nr:AAA family ATPase [Lachnospiraceae bacterium]